MHLYEFICQPKKKQMQLSCAKIHRTKFPMQHIRYIFVKALLQFDVVEASTLWEKLKAFDRRISSNDFGKICFFLIIGKNVIIVTFLFIGRFMRYYLSRIGYNEQSENHFLFLEISLKFNIFKFEILQYIGNLDTSYVCR